MKYEVTYRSIQYYTADVEADSFEQAREIAEEMDGSEFAEDIFSGEWELDIIVDELGRDRVYT